MKKIKVTTGVKQEVANYRQFMLEHEYTDGTATSYGIYLSWFLCQPEQDDDSSLHENILCFLSVQRTANPGNFKACRAALHLYFKMATGKNYPKCMPKENYHGIEVIVKKFYDFSVNIKRIRPSSAISEAVTVQNFLKFMTSTTHCKTGNITAHNIRDYVVSRLSHLKDSSKGRYITAIRNFFRFQEFIELPVQKTIFQLPLSPAVWKNAAFPKTMNENVFNRLHEIPDCNTPAGKRDHCIILCFTELALRCKEVAELTIDDFKWREGSVTIKNTKTRLDRKLPVSEKLGQAVIECLRNSRPQTTSKTVFVRFKHKCGEPMGTEQIRGVVRRVYAKTGIEINSTGTHILRRTAASKIYNAGNSLKMTADILGHESLVSTIQYIKTDMVRLRQIASPWPQMPVKAGLL